MQSLHMSCVVHDVETEVVSCPTCGSSLMTLVNSDDVDEEMGPPLPPLPQIKIKPKAVPAADKEPPMAPVAKRPRLTPNPGITKVDAVQKTVRISMLKCIPGFNQVKAQAVVEAFPAGTFGEIMDASLEELASIGYGQSGCVLGVSLAEALRYVVR